MAARMQDVLSVAYADRPHFAVSTDKAEKFNAMLMAHVSLVDSVHSGVPINTKDGEDGHINCKKYLMPMCHTLGVPWWRPMPATMSPQELYYEQILLALLVPSAYEHMQPGPKTRRLNRPADPQSAMAVVGNVNRSLGRHSDDRFSTRQAKQALTGLLASHVDTHGPIQPDRQLPFSREILAAILKLPRSQLGTYTLDTL